ncbi:MBL fold metallo-hydrolase [Rubellimicrobium rubrum]|uniref:MBL fold metallo-hydrolase n=1 Tax=Rubellimicrobium rubrum TaxID=2585369 RepID=A0A5C4N3H7_9RHOB|nr:MBL fold metallo-hydrolase [Rubellimicrobium rubrum]TNC51072.1 MBL fold metallo-hydrolase [Rubellimicrobium rubrum]
MTSAQVGWGVQLAPGVVRIRAPNPSPFTAQGTNTYILGETSPCVIDPGPDHEGHLEAVLAELRGRRPAAILVTHAHRDHSGLAPALAHRTGAPVMAFGDAWAGLRPGSGRLGPEWGADLHFAPDQLLADGERIRLEDRDLIVWHTPGHMGNHLCFDDGAGLFTGDHAMGFATSIVSPPEGDMGDYIRSLERLLTLGQRQLLPGHGEPVADGQARLSELMAHRRTREAQVLLLLKQGPATPVEVAKVLYPNLHSQLGSAAARTVLAHLLLLERTSQVAREGPPGIDTPFRCV